MAYYSRLIGERNNWIFSGIYADEDRSGTKLNGRDEFQKMMQAHWNAGENWQMKQDGSYERIEEGGTK